MISGPVGVRGSVGALQLDGGGADLSSSQVSEGAGRSQTRTGWEAAAAGLEWEGLGRKGDSWLKTPP